MNTGKVKWYSSTKGYGFILCDSGKEVFCHYTQTKNDLKENDCVQFDLYETDKGYNAKNVVKL